MSEPSRGFLDVVMRRHFGPDVRSCPRMRRADLERLLTDDAQRRLDHARAAAVDWATTDTHGAARITSERLMITPRGLLYAAELSAVSGRRYFMATAPLLFGPLVDRVSTTRLPTDAAVAVDSRFGSDLVFTWPLDGSLRRMFDRGEPLRLGPR